MPITQTTYKIKDLPAINQEAQLVDKFLEVESGNQDENFRVSVPTLVQTVANNLPGANNTKSGYKMVRTYDTLDPIHYRAPDQALTTLNPDFLCLGAICRVELPVSKEYILIWSPTGPLQVWVDGTFNTNKIGAKWVELGSLEDQAKGIADFNPFKDTYLKGDTVKFAQEGKLSLYAAKLDMTRVSGGLLPEPTPASFDPNWQLVNAPGQTSIREWAVSDYKKGEIVIYNNQILWAKRDISGNIKFTSPTGVLGGTGGQDLSDVGQIDTVPSINDWQFLSSGGGNGGGSGVVYDDTVLVTRLSAVETDVTQLQQGLNMLDSTLTSRLDSIVSLAPDWVLGSYEKGQFVRNGNGVFIAKQNIQSSTVAPTQTNAFWLQVNGSAGTEVDIEQDLFSNSTTAVPSVSAVKSVTDTKVDKVAGMGLSEANFTNIDKDNLSLVKRTNFRGIEIGINNDASTGANPDRSVAIGLQNTALQYQGMAIGFLNTSANIIATAIGIFNKANGIRSQAFGVDNISNGERSITFGTGNVTNNTNSIAIGAYNTTNANNQIILSGFGYAAPADVPDTLFAQQVRMFTPGSALTFTAPNGTLNTLSFDNANQLLINGAVIGVGGGNNYGGLTKQPSFTNPVQTATIFKATIPPYFKMEDAEYTLNNGYEPTSFVASQVIGNEYSITVNGAKPANSVGIRLKAFQGKAPSDWLFNAEDFISSGPSEYFTIGQNIEDVSSTWDYTSGNWVPYVDSTYHGGSCAYVNPGSFAEAMLITPFKCNALRFAFGTNTAPRSSKVYVRRWSETNDNPWVLLGVVAQNGNDLALPSNTNYYQLKITDNTAGDYTVLDYIEFI